MQQEPTDLTQFDLATLYKAVEQQQAILQAQQAEIQQLKATIRDLNVTPKINVSQSADNSSTSRRKMLKKLAVGTAGITTLATLTTLPAQTASAAGGIAATSNDDVAVKGVSYAGSASGVYGYNGADSGGVGVTGTSDSGTGRGVIGNSLNGIGVVGNGTKQTGVYGTSTDGTGVVGFSSNNLGAYFVGGLAPIRLIPAQTAGMPASGIHSKGELYVDSNGSLYYCKADGTPGTWVLLSNSGGGTGTTGPSLNILSTPVRIVDTISGTSLNSSTGSINGFGPITNGDTGSVNSNTRNFAGRGGSSSIPSSATAITGYIYCNTQSKNFSVKAGYGYLTLWKQGNTYPLASQSQGIVSLYYTHGVSSGAAFTVGLSEAGQFSVASDSTTDISIEVTGYYL